MGRSLINKAKCLGVFIGWGSNLILLTLLLAGNAFGQTVYYANSLTGNDANDGLTPASAKKTFTAAFNAAAAGDIIDLTGTFTWTDVGESTTASTSSTTGGFNINKSIVIRGQGAEQTTIQANALPDVADRRVFITPTTSNINITFQDLTIANGKADAGAGIHYRSVGGVLTAERVIFKQNIHPITSTRGGGALHLNANNATVNFQECAFRENVSLRDGSDIYVTASTTTTHNITINKCEFSGGKMQRFGAFYFNQSGVLNLNVQNSTFANYSLASDAFQTTGGFFNGCWFDVPNATNSNITFINNTFCYNSFGGRQLIDFGGCNNDLHQLTIKNNLIHSNSFIQTFGDNIETLSSQVVSENNIIEIQSNGTAIGTNGIDGNIFGTQASINLANVLALNDNPGFTRTVVLLAGSVAIDAGTNTGAPTTDQRGAAINGTRDIGAYEFDPCFGADPIAPPTDGNGAYLISTFNHLRWISENPSSWAADFIQTADINAGITANSCYNSGSGWSSIGNSPTKFTGSYNGAGHTIANLSINRSNISSIGLFGQTDGATIQNLGLIDATIMVTGVGFGANTGSLVGLADNGTVITECFASGGSVTAEGAGVGGLIGQLWNSSLNNSYAIVAVDGAIDQRSSGLVGVNTSSTISNCYAAGSVALNQVEIFFGTFITYSQGLTSNNGGTITNSFYDSDATGQSTGGGTAKTTAEMQQQATFTNWDFQCETTNGTAFIWGIDEGNNYPVLTQFGFDQGCRFWTGNTSSDWETASNWNPQVVPTNSGTAFINTATNYPNITTSAEVGTLSLTDASSELIVSAGSSLSVAGAISNDGEIILQANSNGTYAQLKFDGNYSGTGTITQQQYLTNGWYNIAVPVSGNAGMLGEVGADRHPNAQNLRYWDASVGNWMNVADNAEPLTAGRGYHAFIGANGVQTASGIITVSGTPNVSVNPTMDFNLNPPTWTDFGGGEKNGWNLIANPFCASLDFTSLSGRTANVENSFHIWNSSSNSYVSWANGAPSDGVIPPMQSFWVRAQDASSPSLGTLTYANTTVAVTPSFRKTASISDHVMLRVAELAQPKNADAVTFALTFENATDGFDNDWDARKILNPDAVPNIFSIGGGTATSINAVPFVPGTSTSKMIPLGLIVQTPSSAAYSIALDASYLNDYSFDIYLEDNKKKIFHNLKKGSYNFLYDKDAPYRFKLHFGGANGLVANKHTTSVIGWIFDNNVFVRSNDYKGSVRWHIVDLNGREVFSSDFSEINVGETQQTTLTDLANGLYILSIVTEGGIEHIKFRK